MAIAAGSSSSLLVELPLGEASNGFDLEKAICSHGLFMLPPNHWDPVSRSFSRPLRLTSPGSPPLTVTLRISQPLTSSSTLHLHVYGTRSLSPPLHHSLITQVARMLRLSESEENKVREFRTIVRALHGEEEYLRSFSGRVFRSPTLFEDMVKCILLCNCQFSRTLSMAKALCELQFEIQHQISSAKAVEDDFIPKTPVGKELKRKWTVCKVSMCLESKFAKAKADHLESDLKFSQDIEESHYYKGMGSFPSPVELANLDTESDIQLSQESKPPAFVGMGSFPCPEELANLDESFLAKRCNLGYRAGRILKLAQGIVQDNIQLMQLEEDYKETSLSSYNHLVERLRQIDGFGPFTCANVLMCMGFYHVIPADSETIRHLKQVHSKRSSIQTVARDVELIYAKYAPFQFLAYWGELWHFYGQRFGKLSELPVSDYKLITASNMKMKKTTPTRKSGRISTKE